MPTILCDRGRTVTTDDLETIRALLEAHPEASRRAFSQRLCEHGDWRQSHGALRDRVCRSLLLALHRAEPIRLPAVRHRPPNNAIARRRPMAVEVDSTPLECRLGALRPVELLAVRRTPLERLFDHLIADSHDLGPMQGVGEQLKYLVDRVRRTVLENLLEPFRVGIQLPLPLAVVLGQEPRQATVAVLPHIFSDRVFIHPHHVGYLPVRVALALEVDHPASFAGARAGVPARLLVQLVQLFFGQFQIDHLQASTQCSKLLLSPNIGLT